MNGRIALPTSSDYLGLYSEENDYGISLACTIQYFTHHNKVFFLWEVLFVFGSLIIAFCVLRKAHFWEAAGTVCIFSVLWMYCFGLLGILKWGFYTLLLWALAAFVFLIFYIFRHRVEEVEIIWKEQVQSGWLCWIALIFLYFVVDFGKIIQCWDEMTHWAVAAQDMYMFDAFSVHENSSVVLMRYPPVYTIFQYLFMQLYGKSSAGMMHFAKHFFESALLLSCLEGERERKLPLVVMVIFCIGLPEVFFSEYIVDSLYNDITIGILFGYSLVQLKKMIDNFSAYHVLTFLLSVIACILSKDTGLVFILVMTGGIVCVVLYQLLIEKQGLDKNWTKGAIVTAIAVVLGELSWHGYLKNKLSQITVQTNVQTDIVGASGVKKNRFIEYLIGNGEAYQYEIIPRHIKKLLFGNDFSNRYFDLSFGIWIILICVFLWFIVKKRKEEAKYSKWLVFIISASLGVCLAFQLLYTFTFSKGDALVFASEKRYLGGFLTGVTLLCFCIMKSMEDDRRTYFYKKLMIGGCLAILLFTDFCLYYRVQSGDESEWNRDVSEDTYNKAIQLRRLIQEKETVYCISKGDTGNRYLCYRYYLIPAKTNPREGNIGSSGVSYYPVLNNPNEYEYQITPEEWSEVLREYDYLFIDRCDKDFTESYGSLFEDVEDIEDGGLYRVSPGKDKILRRYTTVVAENQDR